MGLLHSDSENGIGESRPQELAFEEALGLKSGLSWNPVVWCKGESGNMSKPSDTEELGLGVASAENKNKFIFKMYFFLIIQSHNRDFLA